MALCSGLNGALSGIVLVCGIVFCVLMELLVRKIVNVLKEDENTDAYAASVPAPYWVLGFAFIVPGLIGIIASFVQRIAVYIIQMALCIIGLVTVAVSFLGGINALAGKSLFALKTCQELRSIIIPDFTCDDISSINGVSVGAGIMLMIGWISMFIVTLLAGKHACAREGHTDKEGRYDSHHLTDTEWGAPEGAFIMKPIGYVPQSRYSNGWYGDKTLYAIHSAYSSLPRYVVTPGTWVPSHRYLRST